MKTLFTFLALFFSIYCFGQSGKLFTVDRELSNSIINSIYQDKNGVIWIATEDGLNRYDGAKFSVYKHEDENEHSLIDNNVNVLYEDSKGHFLVGTLRGLQLHDTATGLFTEIPLNYEDGTNTDSHITQILERKNGNLLVATSGHGIYSIDFTGEIPVSTPMEIDIPSLFINQIFEDLKGNLWISTEGKGLYRLGNSPQPYKYFSEKETTWNIITSICQDTNGNIYAGSLGRGLFIYEEKNDSFLPISYSSNPNLAINTLYPANQDEIYIGTMGHGIKVYDLRTGKIKESEFNITSFNFNKSEIHSIMKDRTGNIWLGINTKGVMLMPAITNEFKYLGYKSQTANPIGSNSIMAVCKDHAGTLWLGTANDGIYGISANGELRKHFEHTDDPRSVPANVTSIYEDSNHNLWLGSPLDGLAKMNTQTGQCEYPTLLDHKSNKVKRVFCITEDNDKRLWVGAMGGGLFHIDLGTGEITRCPAPESGKEYTKDINLLHNRWIASLLCTRNNKLYIGSYDGLGCLDLKTSSFISTYGVNRLFPGGVIYTLYEDSKGDIWAGTAKGLIHLNEKTKESATYTIHDGLPNNVICGIREDSNHNLWLSTNYGISRFSPHNGSFINYYAGDGLQGNEFSKRAAFKDEKGNLIFGGINGITYFNPNNITVSIKKPEIRIADFYIHDRAVKKGMTSGMHPIISTAVTEAGKFHLSYKDNSFSIEFSAMEFYNPERIVYTYSINDDKWITLQPGINRVSFTDLPAGNYRFKVKAKDYTAYSDVKEIQIIVHPAWYASAWARLVYILLLLTIVYIIIIQVRHRYRAHQELLQHIHAEQINEAKLQFFINISHEIRTPMSLIISPLQKLIAADKDKERQKSYLTIYRNASRILQLVNQLMDIRKIDKGQMALLFHRTNIVEFIGEICTNFGLEANPKQIALQFHPENEIPDVWIDTRHFDKIILNLLSNAFKFTPEQGKVDVYLRTGEDETAARPLQQYLEIIISDNGIGIDEKEREHIFERFYQIRNSHNNSNVGTGIGLHLTRSLVELHYGSIRVENNTDQSGCRFIIRLPLGKEHLRAEEIEDSTDTPRSICNAPVPLHVEAALPEEDNKIKVKSKRYILIVEDDEEIRKYICSEMGKDYHMIESCNGKEALALILKKAPDLVISDVMMPEMDGFTLCRKIKQNVTINHVPVILLTAKSSEEDNLEGLSLGADAYIVKPFNIEILRKTAENIIRNREQLRNTFSGQQDQSDKIQKLEVQSPDDKLLKKRMKVINDNISNPSLTVEMITTEVGISRVHLHRKLKELTNQTTRDLIRNVRLQQAAALLASGRHNISEVAMLTGFPNATYFSTAFKEMYGVPPTVYMEQHAGEEKERE